ncbi:response regulator [Pseudoalteromonas umbrosa]|uniref:response regulator n=1 Tax=Pseudoalteromonas umbrosa TaxID=3048489 RepID=UPI0024C291F6|nr:response regulator [Pseudoalteromonas sp. B95]MDK1288054.1 response regulator [Pseudoalteromonas sp. B95]
MKIKPTNVLILDDDKLILRALSRALKKQLGVENIVALNDSTLLEQYLANSNDTYDLFITDYQMPTLDGEQALKIVQQQSPLTTRVLMSGDIDSIRIRPKNIPANIMIAKPFTVDDLQLLSDIYERSQATNLSQELQLKLGFMPYVPLPTIELIKFQKKRDNTDLNNIGLLVKHLDSLVDKVVLDTRLKSSIKEAGYEITIICSQFMEQLICGLSACSVRKIIEKYYLLGVKAFMFAKRNNLQLSECENVFQYIYSLCLNDLIRIYIEREYRKNYEPRLYDHFASIWGLDAKILSQRNLIFSNNTECESDLICRAIALNIGSNNEFIVSDILDSSESTINCLKSYSRKSAINSQTKEELL